MIHSIPSLHTLDLHVVTEAERKKAESLFGSGAERVAKSLAFGQRAPHRPAAEPPVRGLESDLEKSIARLSEKERRREEAAAGRAQSGLFSHLN